MAAYLNEAAQTYYRQPGDDTLSEVLIAGDGLVRSCAGKFAAGCDLDDLYQTGEVGLMRAVRSFDVNKGVQFSTWAYHCIISELLHLQKKEYRAAFCSPAQESEMESGFSIPEAPFNDVLGSTDRIDDRVALEGAFKQLSVFERTVLVLLYGCDLTETAAAGQLGTSQKKVSRSKLRALKILRETIGGQSEA